MNAPGSARVEGFRYVNVAEGGRGVSADPTVMFTMVLGSCVAACLFDPEARIGGVNHFLLAEPQPGQLVDAGATHRYGVHAMELLINDMLREGARRERLRAHLYGGASLYAGLRAIGNQNADFATRFLHQEGIPLVASDLGGRAARRVEFQAALGRARALTVRDVAPPPPSPHRPAPAYAATPSGELDLF